MPMDRLECIGYEIGILLRFAWFTLIAEVSYAVIASTGLYFNSNVAVFLIYCFSCIGTLIYDYATLGPELPNPMAQMIRSALDMSIFILFSEFLVTSNPISTQEALEIANKSVTFRGSWLSLNMFLFGLFFANMAFMACFRAIINTMISIYLGYVGFCEYWYGRPPQTSTSEEVVESSPPEEG